VARLGYQQWLARHLASAPNPSVLQAYLQQAAVAGTAMPGMPMPQQQHQQQQQHAAARSGSSAGSQQLPPPQQHGAMLVRTVKLFSDAAVFRVWWPGAARAGVHAQGFPGMMPFPFGAQQQQQQMAMMAMQQQAAAAAAAMFAAGAASSGCVGLCLYPCWRVHQWQQSF
jgi:hypothetical protein